MTILLTLFAAGVLTILLPCILPLVPIVLGVSLSGRNKWRPLVTATGMAASFVAFTLVLQLLLRQFVQLADLVRVATYYTLLLFGICFVTTRPHLHGNPERVPKPSRALALAGKARLRLHAYLQIALAALGALPFFWGQGWLALSVSPLLGAIAVALGGRVATRMQQAGARVQHGASAGLGSESLLSALVVGLTLGLVWVPCAGPALGFALTLVRDQPGFRAFLALTAYAVGAALPLLFIGYGGQRVVRGARGLIQYSGRIKQVSGAVLVLSALAFQFQWFAALQTWLGDHTSVATFGSVVEARLVGNAMAAPAGSPSSAMSRTEHETDRGAALPQLPKLARAPELAGLGPWYNSPPLTLASLKGKVVLVDFWTYSCINCVRTLPHIQELWSSYKDQPFVIVGVHAPEFTFEKKPENVADAIRKHHLEYPIAQDNDFATWKAFENQYWPAKYLIDAQGVIRYTHFGEGDYGETEQAVRSLLAELGRVAGGNASGTAASGAAMRREAQSGRLSPETYLGPRGWTSFANRTGMPDARAHRYVTPRTLPIGSFSLAGEWELVDGERQVLRSGSGEIRYRAVAGEVNLVLGVEKGEAPVTVDVRVDGKIAKSITVDRHDLYNLYAGPYGEHEVALEIRGKNLSAYAFTFGA
jgi:cytochrome c biogenesis protein CcdA/thiol-disulfide isomerase/thioredoxin